MVHCFVLKIDGNVYLSLSLSLRLWSSSAQEKVLGTDYLTQVLEWSKNRITCLQDLLLPEFSYVWVLPVQLPLSDLPTMACSHGKLNIFFSVIESILETFAI